MAKLAPIVTIVPGFGHTLDIPVRNVVPNNVTLPNATEYPPNWDNCGTAIGITGWDALGIQLEFKWPGSSKSLRALLNRRLTSRGWVLGSPPWWSTDQSGQSWNYPASAPDETFEVDQLGGHWLIEIQAKPRGRLIQCSD
jgi:hypothetical protein